jgi:hypothetical protein
MTTPLEPPVEPPEGPLADAARPYAWYGAEPADPTAYEATAPWAPEPADRLLEPEPERLGPAQARPARLVVGLASLAADRIRSGAGTNDALVVTVGLLGRTADGSVAFARRLSSRPIRVARFGGGLAAKLPGLRRLGSPVDRARERFNRMAADARMRGQITVAAGRADARTFVQSTVDDGIGWAQAEAVPRIVDGLVPQLVDKVVPRIIEGAMPEIRARVLPVVIEDLTNEPRVRDLIMEQSRTGLGDAADQLRTSTASADDRVESAFRRMFPGSNHEGGDQEDVSPEDHEDVGRDRAGHEGVGRDPAPGG